jgi:hypothetical protein
MHYTRRAAPNSQLVAQDFAHGRRQLLDLPRDLRHGPPQALAALLRRRFLRGLQLETPQGSPLASR